MSRRCGSFARNPPIGLCVHVRLAVAQTPRPLDASTSFDTTLAPKTSHAYSLRLGAGESVSPLIPVSQVRELESVIAANHLDAEVFTYEGAGHAFCAYVEPELYHDAAAQLAWQRGERFMRERFG